MKKFESFEQLNDIIKQSGDVLTMPMEILRNMHGASKLGIQVREDISDKLNKLGLKHYPEELPSYQNNCVRIYRSGSPLDKLYQFMTHIKNNDDMASNLKADKYIKEITSNEYQEIIKKIKMLVCD